MDNSELAKLLQTAFEDGLVEVAGEGGHIHVNLVSQQFEGLSRVKRQQLVYRHLSGLIASGDIHAVTMTTLTPSERQSV